MQLMKQQQKSTEMDDDFRYGQVIIAVARWFLLALGMFVTLYRPDSGDLTKITAAAGLVWGLTLFNAFLHGRAIINKPVGPALVYAASVMDIAVISGLIALYSGFHAYFFVFYYPAILAFSLVFRPTISLSFTAAVMFIYALLSVFVGDGVHTALQEERVLITRLVIMLAVSAIGTYFWRIERQRRTATVKDQVESQMEDFRRSLGVRQEAKTDDAVVETTATTRK